MKRLNVVSVQMVKEKTYSYEVNTIRSPFDAARLFREFIGPTDREHMVLLCLDTKNKITAIHTVSIGCLNASIVHPREVFKIAILANSASIVLAHNHPTGDVTPSPQDLEVTRRIAEIGELVGIELLDHLIVGDEGRWLSLKEKGHF